MTSPRLLSSKIIGPSILLPSIVLACPPDPVLQQAQQRIGDLPLATPELPVAHNPAPLQQSAPQMPISSSNCAQPPQAASVGYNELTYGNSMGVGLNWHPTLGDAASSGITQNSDGSVTLNGSPNWNFNDQISTGDARFGGGAYVQATLAIKNPLGGWDRARGWPSFWLKSNDDSQNIEVDVFEFMDRGQPTFQSGLIDWGNGGRNTAPNAGIAAATPAGFDPSKPHKYGWLWVPATANSPGYAKTYVDGQLVQQIGSWEQGGGYGKLDRNKLKIMLGTSTSNPMTVYDVQVWQASTEQDVGVGSGVTCAPPTNTASAPTNIQAMQSQAIVPQTSLSVIGSRSFRANSPLTGGPSR